MYSYMPSFEDRYVDKIVNKYKEEKNMDNSFMKGMFGPIKGGLCRLSMQGGIAIKTNGGYKTYDAKSGTFINCDDFVFDVGDEMFFIIPTNNVAVGDIILASGSPRYVLAVEDNQIKAINYQNGTIDTIIPERHMFMGNTYFYGKIVSMFGNIGTFASNGGAAENVMKYMMMSQMMKGMGTNTNGMNPMMMMMMMNGGGMGNIFDGLFSAAKPDVASTEVKEEK